METKFDLKEFIVHSNAIDKQYDKRGTYIPGNEPGELMYDNMLNAWNLCAELAKKDNITVEDVYQIHTVLTHDVDFFDYYDGRGKPRIVDVKVGFTLCPSPTLVPILMEMFVELWNHELKKEDDAPYAQAYYLHNVFESIHPFIDGNGRTGRLLLNMFLMAKGVEPIVIKFEDRFDYYRQIQFFYPDFKPYLMEANSRAEGNEKNPIIES